MFRKPKQPTSGAPSTAAGSIGSTRPGRMRDVPDRAAVAGGAHAGLDVARVDDQAVGEVEHGAREREPLRLRLPEERQEVVEDAEAEQPPGDAELALHRVEVAAAVPRPIVIPAIRWWSTISCRTTTP